MFRGPDQNKAAFLSIWILSLPLLAYAPVVFQRRLVEGIWAAWVILAVSIFDHNGKQIWFSLKPALTLTLPSMAIIFVMGFQTASQKSPPLFLPADEVHAYMVLAEVANPNDVLLSAAETGNRVPAWAVMRVVLGLGPESLNSQEIIPRVERFYSSSETENERNKLLDEFSVDYVFYGPLEKALGSWIPDEDDFQVVVNGEYSIYKVLHTVDGQ